MADGKQSAQDAWRAYLELAMGVTEASKKRAQKVAKRLAGRGGATAQQLQSIADSLVSTSLANREALTKLVRFEVDRAISALGLATAEEVADLQARIRDLERQLREEQARHEPGEPGGAVAATKAVAKKTTVAKAAVPAKAPARTTTKKAVAKKATAGKAPTKSSVAKKVTPPAAGLAPE